MMDLGSELDRAGASPYADAPRALVLGLLVATLLIPIGWIAARLLS